MNKSVEKVSRVEGLDELRGLLAFAVMLYHFSRWSGLLEADSKNPLVLLGIYAVSSFYVLSGAALYIVYHRRAVNFAFLKEFFTKRTFRIVPLFWFVSALAILPNLLRVAQGRPGASLPSTETLLLNFSLLFSWFSPVSYVAVGAWSIGNEWAFYTLFPVILWAFHHSKTAFHSILGISGVICICFAFFKLSPDLPLDAQWAYYVDPLNQFVLFAGGFWTGAEILSRRSGEKARPQAALIGVTSTVVFVAVSFLVTQPESVTGIARLLLIGICFAWCYSAGILEMPGVAKPILTTLGNISFSLYLLHPIVYQFGLLIVGKFGGIERLSSNSHYFFAFGVALPATICVSLAVYHFLEKPSMRYGRRLLA